MQKTTKRVLAFMLSLLMVVSMVLPTNAIAKTVKKTAKAATTTTYQTKIEFEKATVLNRTEETVLTSLCFPGIPGTDMFI